MAKQEKEVERWITVNGARVPIFKDGSVGGPPALRKKVESSLKKKSEKKDSFQRAADHEVSNVQNAKENVELLKKELKKHPDDAHTAEIKARLKKAQEDHKKLKKGDTSDSNFKTAKEWDAGKDKKSSYNDEIKKIANEHLSKVWNREGGVANKELYDAADKIAEVHGLDKAEVRNTAMRAFEKKQMAEIKNRREAEAATKFDPYNADDDKYATKLKVGDKVKIERNGKEYHAVIKELDAEVHSTLPNGRHVCKPAYEATILSDTGKEEYNIAGANKTRITPDEIKGVSKRESSKNDKTPKAAPKSKTPEFKSAEEAEKYYQEKFAGVSSTYANKMAAKLGIEGKGKEKREALAKAYTEKWKQSQSINKDLDLKEKQIAQNKSIKDKISAAEDRELERELKRTHPAAFGNSSQKESLNKPNWEVEKGRYGEATTTVGDTTYRIFYNKQWGQFTLKERRKDGAGWITTGGDFRHPITLGYSKQEALMNAMEYLENQKKRGRNNAKHL